MNEEQRKAREAFIQSVKDDKRREDVVTRVMKIIQEAYPDPDTTAGYISSKGFSEILTWFEGFHAERIFAEYIRQRIQRQVEIIDRNHSALLISGRDEDDPFVYNDLDNEAFYLSHDHLLITVIRYQSGGFLFVRDPAPSLWGKKRLQVYRVFRHLNREWYESEKPPEDYLNWTLKQATWFHREYSDDVPEEGGQYKELVGVNDGRVVYRPSLDYFKRHGFDRDKFRPLYDSEDLAGMEAVEIYNFYQIERFISEVQYLAERLEEDGQQI